MMKLTSNDDEVDWSWIMMNLMSKKPEEKEKERNSEEEVDWCTMWK